jgi:hypothetical protein
MERSPLARGRLAAAIAAVLVPGLALAGSITGQVVDQATGRPLADAIVSLDGSSRTATTVRPAHGLRS